MLVDTLAEKPPAWLSDAAPEAAIALFSQCTLARNLSDFPFPHRCTPEERAQVQDRVVSTLDTLSLFATGKYCALDEASDREARFLAERRLITSDLIHGESGRGVYIADDQALSIMVNGLDHVLLRGMAAGNQIHEVWARLNLMDDTLSGMLDFAFDRRLGYQTATLGMVGTGLKGGIMLHLPGLVLSNRIEAASSKARDQHLQLRGIRIGADEPKLLRRGRGAARRAASADESLYSDVTGVLGAPLNETVGDLFLLSNDGTLGAAEEELIFHLRHASNALIEEEKEARAAMQRESPRSLEDRVGRAQGLACAARLIGFAEGINLLSAIRLGIACGVLSEPRLQTVNELLLYTQQAHLAVTTGRDSDELTLSSERADLFRSRLTG